MKNCKDCIHFDCCNFRDGQVEGIAENHLGQRCPNAHSWSTEFKPGDVISILKHDGIHLDTVAEVSIDRFKGIKIYTFNGQTYTEDDIGVTVFTSSAEA